MNAEHGRPDRETTLYRLEVVGRVDPSWIGWFDADTLTTVGENTILDVRVTDQAELYGRLRRIHDLNLELLGLSRVAPDDRTRDDDPGT